MNQQIINGYHCVILYRHITGLYVSDGTDKGTYLIVPSGSDQTDPLRGAYIFSGFARINDTLYLNAKFFSNAPSKLWSVTDTTAYAPPETVKPYFTVYPIPTHDLVNVQLDTVHKYAEINLYDISGKMVRRDFFTNTDLLQTDMSGLASGAYIMHVGADMHDAIYKVERE